LEGRYPMVSKNCQGQPNVLSAHCPTRKVLDLIADKWTTLIIYLLADGTKRYGELQKQIDGISQKMLTQTLRKLEEDGLVKRTVFPVVPPRTEYELTPLGQTLIEPLSALCKWATDHMTDLEKVRAKKLAKKAHLASA
jgi:DNA-binding HxlR family transcriptional regulator